MIKLFSKVRRRLPQEWTTEVKRRARQMAESCLKSAAAAALSDTLHTPTPADSPEEPSSKEGVTLRYTGWTPSLVRFSLHRSINQCHIRASREPDSVDRWGSYANYSFCCSSSTSHGHTGRWCHTPRMIKYFQMNFNYGHFIYLRRRRQQRYWCERNWSNFFLSKLWDVERRLSSLLANVCHTLQQVDSSNWEITHFALR